VVVKTSNFGGGHYINAVYFGPFSWNKTKLPLGKGGTMSQAKSRPIRDKQTKSQILAALAEETGLSKKEVQAVLQATKGLAARHLVKSGSGEFTVPELGVKLRRAQKAARKEGMARNPFTGEMVHVDARPASLSVRATAMKAIKDVVA
jgi:nucleoid DNA-binding protein